MLDHPSYSASYEDELVKGIWCAIVEKSHDGRDNTLLVRTDVVYEALARVVASIVGMNSGSSSASTVARFTSQFSDMIERQVEPMREHYAEIGLPFEVIPTTRN